MAETGCPTCAGDGNHGIDLSEAAFMALGDKKKGVLQLEWVSLRSVRPYVG